MMPAVAPWAVYPSASESTLDWPRLLADAQVVVRLVVAYWEGWFYEHRRALAVFLSRGGHLQLVTPDPEDDDACRSLLGRFPKCKSAEQAADRIVQTAKRLRSLAQEVPDAAAQRRITWIRLAQMPPFAAVQIDSYLCVAHFDLRFTPTRGRTPMSAFDLEANLVWKGYWTKLWDNLRDARVNLSFTPELAEQGSELILHRLCDHLRYPVRDPWPIGSVEWLVLRETMRLVGLVERALAHRGSTRIGARGLADHIIGFGWQDATRRQWRVRWKAPGGPIDVEWHVDDDLWRISSTVGLRACVGRLVAGLQGVDGGGP